MSRFPKAIDILSQIQELEGAIIFNFSTKEILGKITREIDLTAVVDILSTTVKHHQNLICELELLDMVEQTLITSNSYYHITYIVPQLKCLKMRYTRCVNCNEFKQPKKMFILK